MPRTRVALRGFVLAGVLAGVLAVAAGGCDFSSQHGGQVVNLPPVRPQAVTTFSTDAEVIDAYLAPAKAGGAVVFHATISNTALSFNELLTVSSPTGTARVHQTVGAGYLFELGAGVYLGTTSSALRFGHRVPITLDFSQGGRLRLSVPVGGTAKR